MPGGDNVIGYASRAIAIEEELGITFGIKRPTAVAGDDIAVSTGSQVMLDGSRSQSKEVLRDVLTYHWEQDFGSAHAATTSRDGVTLSSVSAVSPTFTAPAHATTLKFKLTVTDGFGAKHTDKVIVTVDNIPPIPREDQWEVRQQGNKIQVKATELPTVIPAISQVKAKLGISPLGTGLGSDTITVTKNIGTALDTWVDVLTDDDSNWQAGTWTVQVRFENTEGNSEYSPGMAVTVVSAPTEVSASPAARSVEVAWNVVTGAMGYKVEIGIPPSEGGQNHTFHDSIGTSITIPSLTPQTTYEYRVQATNADGVGPWTAWARVATPGETPPTPTEDQWEVRYRNNKIQVKATELPEVIPAISQVTAKLEIGSGSNKTTVTRDIGARLNRWVDVLTDADSEWQMGTWTAQVRFENTIGDPQYSPGKPVTVLPPNNPPVANAGYNQVARANTRVTLSGAASDPDASDQDDLSYRWSKRSGAFVQMDGTSTLAPTFTAPGFDTTLKFRLTVTDPHGAKDTDNVTVWVYDSLTSPWHDTGEEDGCGRSKRKRQTRLNLGVVKFRWRATPEPVVWTDWEDTGETRNEATGAWTDTGSRRENPVTLVTEKEQTRAITWEKEQERTNNCDQTGTQWVDASRTETQWVEGLPAPTNVTATPSTRSVELSWDAVSGATGYEVEIGIPGNAGGLGHTSETTTDTTITISNLIPEKTYEYRVRGTTSRVDGPWTDWATVVTEGEEPPQPTNDQWKIEYDSDNNEIQAKVVSLPTVIPAISEVRLHMGSGQPPNRTTITKAIGTDLNTWVTVLSSGDTGWATDVTWAAHIRFENSVDESSYSLPGLSVTVPAPLPPLVENVTADPAFRSVELSWDAASGATGYEVEIGIPASAGGLGHTSHTTTGTSITVSSLNPAQTYEYRVRATNAAGDGPWTDWATVVTEGEEPPQPTSDQWNFRYSSNKLQAKVISLPTVTPAITEVELTMETGQPPNLNTVTKNIGTSLDTWVDVLTRGQTGWTTGTWIAQIRFRNSVDYGPYSDVKSDTVPTCGPWSDAGQTRTVNGTWSDTGETRGSGSSRECKESRVNTNEKKQQRTCGSAIETRWVVTSTSTETRWVSCPVTCGPWSDTGRTRNRVNGLWVDTGSTRGCGPSKEKRQSSRTTWEKEQQRTCSDGTTQIRWVSASSTNYQWIGAPEPDPWGRWYNTEHERNEVVGPWRNTSNYRGCGSDRERQQAQTITWENEQERQSHCGRVESMWVELSTTDTKWVDAPQADPWGSWSYTGGTDYDDIEDIVYYEQERYSYPCNRRDTRWVTTRP